jgi:signal transduction histidine kinase
MAIARPLTDPTSGAVDSVLVARVRFKPIWDALAGLDSSDDRDVYVVNTEGEIVAHRNPSIVLQVTSVEIPSSNGRAVGRTGVPVVMASAPVVLDTETLIAVAEQPLSSALLPATKALVSTILVALLAVLLASVAIALIARHVIGPIESLAASARRVAGGHFEPTQLDRSDEIGDLARAFNNMVQELGELVGTLERRVQDRTVELEAAAATQLTLIEELEAKNREMALIHNELEKLVRSKDEFLGSVSHELRTPLASVVGFAAELRDRYEDFDPEQRRELLGLIADQGQDMAHIINDLLVAARADTDSLVVKMEPVDLDAEIEAVLQQTPDVAVGRDVPAAGVVVLADSGRLRQILRNLLTNAGRYGGPDVKVSVSERAAEALVSVIDNGSGIPESEWETIFDPYSRSHHREGQPASVGLGLTVSRLLARKMGGDLTYRYVDRRSVFELVLARPAGSAHP